MNNKNKVLKILDKHRDMSLTMGCEVIFKDSEYDLVQSTIVTVSDNGFMTKDDDWYHTNHLNTILGHPATPLTLLKALDVRAKKDDYGYWYGFDTDGADAIRITKMFGSGVQEHYDLTGIELPYVTTLTELPHTHKLWTDLLPILS